MMIVMIIMCIMIIIQVFIEPGDQATAKMQIRHKYYDDHDDECKQALKGP